MPEYIVDSEATRTPEDWCRANSSGEVVRCRDCKHYETGICRMLIWRKSGFPPSVNVGDRYCAWGERKERSCGRMATRGSGRRWNEAGVMRSDGTVKVVYTTHYLIIGAVAVADLAVSGWLFSLGQAWQPFSVLLVGLYIVDFVRGATYRIVYHDEGDDS